MRKNVQDIAWANKWNTDISSLDLQHKNLASTVESLKVLERVVPIPDSAYDIFLNIISDVRSHFSYEEKILLNIGYNELDHHIKVHQDILDKLIEIQETILIPKDDAAMPDAIILLEETIAGHLSGEDSKIKKYIHRVNPIG